MLVIESAAQADEVIQPEACPLQMKRSHRRLSAGLTCHQSETDAAVSMTTLDGSSLLCQQLSSMMISRFKRSQAFVFGRCSLASPSLPCRSLLLGNSRAAERPCSADRTLSDEVTSVCADNTEGSGAYFQLTSVDGRRLSRSEPPGLKVSEHISISHQSMLPFGNKTLSLRPSY